MLAFTEVTSMRLLLRRTQFRKTQFRKTLSLVVTFLALALSLTSAAPAQKPNVGRSASPQSAPFYAYRNLPAQMDPGRIGSSNFEAMEAQERLAQAQRSYVIRNRSLPGIYIKTSSSPSNWPNPTPRTNLTCSRIQRTRITF
jgi:hypothetical protein